MVPLAHFARLTTVDVVDDNNASLAVRCGCRRVDGAAAGLLLAMVMAAPLAGGNKKQPSSPRIAQNLVMVMRW